MELQGGELTLQMHGEDVKLLQSELRQLGYELPTQEVEQSFFGQGTRNSVLRFQRQHNLQPTGVVEEQTAKRINEAMEARQRQFVVQGTIYLAESNARAKGILIRAFDKDLRSEELLGRTVSDEQGFYRITYTAAQFARAEKRTADLIVRAYAQDDAIVGEEGIRFNAGPEEIIDLKIRLPQARELSEYEKLLAALEPVLQDLPPPELTEEDITFLLKECADEPLVDQRRLNLLAQSARLARETALPTEFFYGVAQQRPIPLPLNLEVFLALDTSVVRKALVSAVEQGIIPSVLLDTLDGLLARFEQLKLEGGFLAQQTFTGRLINEETEEPLASFRVRAIDLDADPEPREIGSDITNRQGIFTFAYLSPTSPDSPEEDAAARKFRLHIQDPQREEIHQVEIEHLAEREVVDVRVPAEALPKPPTHPLDELPTTLDLDLPQPLLSFLAERNIRTLEDIRKEGGIRRLEGLPVAMDDRAVKTLEAHAILGILSSDLVTNAVLIEKGFPSITAIANKTRPEFIRSVREELGDVKAAELHVRAEAQTRFLNNVLTNLRAEVANGWPSTHPELTGTPPELEPWFRRTCECRDCDAAVSPLAYLADLLDYAVRHVQNRSAAIDLDFLSLTFHQSFRDLPATCEAMKEQVRQVRICVEVLRSYLAAEGVSPVETAEAEYRLKAFTTLLTRLGTSYDELRLARTATADNEQERQALADRLGIDLQHDGSDHLAVLHREPASIGEQDAERLFGLADTTRHPLSEGAKLGDERNQIVQWNLDGAEWDRNTDYDGSVYISLTQPDAATFRVELYRDRTNRDTDSLVASGERTTARGPVGLTAENDSGLSGYVAIDFDGGAEAVEIVAIPRLLSWRLAHLRTLWRLQDWPADPYREEAYGPLEARDLLPVIDPDVVGPDDFRAPFEKEAETDPDRPFDLWVKRRIWVDGQLNALKGLPVPAERLDRMYEAITFSYPAPDTPHPAPWATATPAGELAALRDDLTEGREVAATTERIRSDLKLTVEEFRRLMEIKDKYDDPEETPEPDEELEFLSILVQARKRSLFDVWRSEEQDLESRLGHALFGPKSFWISLREPKEGAWPPVIAVDRPWIDPDAVDLDDLPDPPVGERAIALWQARREVLVAIHNEIKNAHEPSATEGFNNLITAAFGEFASVIASPLEAGDWDAYFTILSNRLRSDGPGSISSELGPLHLSKEAFTRVMAVKTKTNASAEEWSDVYTVLTTARKEREGLPSTWHAGERDDPVIDGRYWNALKARLPKWRAGAGNRRTWQQALRARSSAPVIDPDVISTAYLDSAVTGSIRAIWDARSRAINAPGSGWLAELRSQRESAADPQTGFETILVESVFDEDTVTRFGREHLAARVLSLAEEREKGEGIATRLEQLGLTPRAFDYLLRIRNLLAGGATVLESEWGGVYNTLVQVRKRREFADWRKVERTSIPPIILSQDHFKLPEPPALHFPPPEPLPLPEWRATWRHRRDWEDMLQARIEQEQTVIAAMRAAVSATEEATMPSLRDALIGASGEPGDLPDKGKSLADKLLIDMQTNGCQMTTRVSQAIESVQGLLWSLRTGQLRDAYLDLRLIAPDFDDEWKWIGSYPIWRAAMFVHTYPENILMPSLRRNQTPGFGAFAESSRHNRRITPAVACALAKDYERYFRDVSSLRVQATCQTSARLAVGEDCTHRAVPDERELFYMFARGEATSTAYWSVYDAAAPESSRQSFWQPIPGLSGNVVQLVGAHPYTMSENKRYIFLFAVVGTEEGKELVFTRFDLVGGHGWTDEPEPLDLPDGSNEFRAVIVQRSDEGPPRLVLRVHSDFVWLTYTRSINTEGTGWEETEALRLSTLRGEADSGDYSDPEFEFVFSFFSHVVAVHQLRSDVLLVFVAAPNVSIDGYNLLAARFRFERRRTPEGESVASWHPVDGWRLVGSMSHWSGSRQSDSTVHVYWRSGWAGEGATVSVSGDPGTPYDRGLSSSPERIAVHSGPQTPLTIVSYGERTFLNDGPRWQRWPLPEVAPWVQPAAAREIVYRLPEAERQDRREAISRAFDRNRRGFSSQLTPLEEAYFFVPLHLALHLQQAGHYVAALDWYRTILDYSAPADQRIISPKLRETAPALGYERAEGWLLDPLNPHAIAETRPVTYLRFILLSVIRCLLEYADAEYTRDTAESVPRARTLYATALELLDTEELRQSLRGCDAIIGELEIEIGEDVRAPELIGPWRDIVEELRRIRDPGPLEDAARLVREALTRDAAIDEERLREAYEGVHEVWRVRDELHRTGPRTLGIISEERQSRLAGAHSGLLTRPPIAEAAVKAAGVVGGDFRHAVSVASGIAEATLETDRIELPWLVAGISEDGRIDEHLAAMEAIRRYHTYDPTPSYHFCIPRNPVLRSLRLHAELNLHKIRTCRNIAGMERQLEPYAAPTDTVSGLPQIGVDGQLVLPGAVTLQPTPYRYQVLIERAKQLVQLAAQVEAAMFSAIERRDAEEYQVLKARQEVALARQGVRLQELRLREAENGVELANLQQERAQIQVDTYQEWITEGVIEGERALLDAYALAAEAEKAVVDARVWAQVAKAAVTAATADWTAAAAMFALVTYGTAVGFERHAGRSAVEAQLEVQIRAFHASFERRLQEWELGQELAQQDVLIGAQQIRLAEDHVRVVGQERRIAEMNVEHASDTLEFLNAKFTNVELYDWMSRMLGGVYSFFLQQATAVAKLAENQLAFERQEVPAGIIQTDYWEAPAESAIVMRPDGGGADRRGLTGSTRLLQDIYQLDQHAFKTDQRKLQLTKTISLARMAPAEFQRFRETGMMSFRTPLEMFDRDFPGHYLRLIKRVRTSVIALIPPTEGIHATLSSVGLSRVVINTSGLFQTINVRRSPESVVLTSPSNATGLFELTPQPGEMLLPFEAMGVNTGWEFVMPKASNRFDYSTIADVLITIEYTALNNFDYRQQVIRELDRRISADRPFRFRQEFVDQWYDLHNPAQTSTPMVVRFRTRRQDFPPNVDELRIQQILRYFARADGVSFEVPVNHLLFTEQGATGALGGGATTIDGVISTRRGNAGSWIAMIGRSPIGEWEVALPNTVEMKNRFKNEEVEDILFVITYRGETPPWPA